MTRLSILLFLGFAACESVEPAALCWDVDEDIECSDGEDVNGDGACDVLDCVGMEGLSCWDTNGDGVCDPEEDLDGDGTCDAFDCQGVDGQPGATGPVGEPGPTGPGCQASDTDDGVLIECEDGTSGLLLDGPEGPTGPPGAEGQAGPAGAEGPMGPAGTPGVDGQPGPMGDQGLTGPPGPEGPVGPTGDQGLAGPPGATGATGATGAPGTSCTVEQGDGLATITCDDGSSAVVRDGAGGAASGVTSVEPGNQIPRGVDNVYVTEAGEIGLPDAPADGQRLFIAVPGAGVTLLSDSGVGIVGLGKPVSNDVYAVPSTDPSLVVLVYVQAANLWFANAL